MDFGMPSLIESKSLEECAALCRDLGLSFIELSMEMPEYQPERIGVERLAEAADKFGIYYTLHFEDVLNPWAGNDRVAAAYTETVLRTVEFAKRLSISVLNMHFFEGGYITLPDRKVYVYKEYSEEFMRKVTAFRDACTETVGDSGIKITVENTRSFMVDFVAEGIDLLLQSPVFGLTFDTGHDAAHGFGQYPLIERNSERLCHMHLHDYSPERGDHLPVGEGTLNIEKYLDLAEEHNCRVLLETKTAEGVRHSVSRIREMGRFN